MDTRQIPLQRLTAEEQIAQYRAIVNDVFAHHRHICEQSGRHACSCGDAWPCAKERRAAQLLDWV